MQATADRPQRRRRGGSAEGGGDIQRAIAYLGRYPRLTAFSFIALVLATAAQLAVPQLVQQAIDTVISNDDGVTVENERLLSSLLWVCAIILVLAVSRGLFSFAQTYTGQMLSQDIAFELRNDIFAKIQRLSFSYHDRNRTGQLMVRATDDVERLRVFIGQGLLLAVGALILMVGSLVVLFSTSWRLTLVVLPILPGAMIVFGTFGRIAGPLFGKIQAKLSTVNTILQESIAGMKVVKAFTQEQVEFDRLEASSATLRDERIGVSNVFATFFPMFFLIGSLGQAAVLYFGGRLIINDSSLLTLGQWQKFSLYVILLLFPMGQLGFIVQLLTQASASAKRIFEILDAKNDVEDKEGAMVLEAVNGYVSFEDVSFRYFASSDDVLSHISISAEPGETVALLGTTGSGKTSLINLIPRFYDISEGTIRIDGHDIRDVTVDSLRDHISIVLQETTLFSGTIRDNIAFGKPDATDEEIVAAAQAAAAHDFIVGFPDGYDTPVGERGSTLSGGQKQRVAIARALLLNPKILILDDSTSAVDYETESRIQQALDKLMEGRTSFVIAQRISTVVNADQILILDKGEIVATGTHDELMEDSPIYAEIYHSQLSD